MPTPQIMHSSTQTSPAVSATPKPPHRLTYAAVTAQATPFAWMSEAEMMVAPLATREEENVRAVSPKISAVPVMVSQTLYWSRAAARHIGTSPHDKNGQRSFQAKAPNKCILMTDHHHHQRHQHHAHHARTHPHHHHKTTHTHTHISHHTHAYTQRV